MSDNNSEAHYNPPNILIDKLNGITEHDFISFSIACRRRDPQSKIRGYLRWLIAEVSSWIHRHDDRLPCIFLADWTNDEQEQIRDNTEKLGYKSSNEYITSIVREHLKEA